MIWRDFMYCQNCNKTFPDNHTFCDTCGGKLVNEPASAAAPVNAGYQQTPVYAPQPAYTAPAYPNAVAPQRNETISFGAWFGISVLGIVPFFMGLVMVLVILVGSILSFIAGTLDLSNPLSIIFFVLTLLYFILLLIWAFGGSRKRSLKNYARATLLMSVILIVLGIIAYLVLNQYITDILSNYNLNLY